MATKRTMRRVPEDVAEAKYIHGLISADLGARIGQLAQDQKLDEIHTLTTYLQTWSGIVADLTAESTSEGPQSPPAGWDADLKAKEEPHVTYVTANDIPGTADEASSPDGAKSPLAEGGTKKRDSLRRA